MLSKFFLNFVLFDDIEIDEAEEDDRVPLPSVDIA